MIKLSKLPWSGILTFGILTIGLVATVYLIGQQTHFFGKAAGSLSPQKLIISNISDNSFTVSWVTSRLAIGFVSYGLDGKLGNSTPDDRDQKGPIPRLTHHVTLKKLTPDTAYYFSIVSGGETFTKQGQLYSQTTAPITSDTPPLPLTVFGKVEKSDHAVPEEAVIYLLPRGGSTLSTVAKEGKWLIVTNNARTENLSNYLKVERNNTVEIEAEAGKDGLTRGTFQLEEKPIVLQVNPEKQSLDFTGQSLVRDLNGDGVVNAIDYAIMIKNKIRP